MNKEEQIDEMEQLIVAQIGRTHLSKFVEDENGDLVRSVTIPVYALMETLFNANYRKADEVRKETAIKLYNQIYDFIPVEEQFDFIRGVKFAMQKIEKYGVEVDDGKI